MLNGSIIYKDKPCYPISTRKPFSVELVAFYRQLDSEAARDIERQKRLKQDFHTAH